ncbi:M20/M25/M40 family metallo-hydrolase [Aquimarina hainanensis]|uniref:M20/M25/M40 family metallo-hydrolase n=1 Tax=Aquimarina hainanensis TaxID=1578017 RepID=A0ABW5N4P7_9FLAO
MKKIVTAIMISVLCVSSCKERKKAPETIINAPVVTSEELVSPYFDKVELLKRLEKLASDSYEGRKTGTRGNEMARGFIKETFKKLNVVPVTTSFEQQFTINRGVEELTGVNVIGAVKGTTYRDQYIVITAHYDHLGIKNEAIYNGADDNASGVSALFAFAEHFEKNPPKHSVVLIAFDAEEIGLLGASYFVENYDMLAGGDIVLNINMDMIGRNINDELYVVGTRYHRSLADAVKNNPITNKVKLLIGHDGSDGKDDWTEASDHGPFYQKKIPFLYFGEEDHPDYHKETDEFEGIQPEFYFDAVEHIIGVFLMLDEQENYTN